MGQLPDSIKGKFPLVLSHPVNAEFAKSLPELKMRRYEETSDTRYGKGFCSEGFQFFETPHAVIQKVGEGLMKCAEEALDAKIIFCESFLNVSTGESGTEIHSHLSKQDADFELGLDKYSLVYYPDPGDQTAKHPGILKLYEPNQEILPSSGTVVIIPAGRKHSAVYSGEKARIVIGANFYAV